MARQPCQRCGGEKPPGRGLRYCETCEPRPHREGTQPCRACGTTENKLFGKQYCEECRELRQWAYRERRAAKKVSRRGCCAHCYGRKPPGRGRKLCDSCLAKLQSPPLCRRCKERPIRRHRAQLCERCAIEAVARARVREAKRARAEYLALKATDPGRLRAKKQAQWARVKADPERRARLREQRRMRRRLKAQREGRVLRASQVVIPPVNQKVSLPGRPLAAMFDRLTATHEMGHLCELAGIPDRAVTRWRRGESDVALDTADQVLTGLDLLWWEVWSEESVRLPLFTAHVFHHVAKVNGGRVVRVRARSVPYGDQGPDVALLAEVAALMTGEVLAA